MNQPRLAFILVIALVIVYGLYYYATLGTKGPVGQNATNFGFGPDWECTSRGSLCMKKPAAGPAQKPTP